MSKKLYILIAIVILIAAGFIIFKQNFGAISIPGKVELPEEVNNNVGEVKSLPGFELPDGFSLSIFAKDVPGARVMELDPVNNILVSETDGGKIVALLDKDFDGVAEEQKVLASGLNKPHGLAMSCRNPGGSCFLYVAEENALSRYEYNSETPSLGTKEKLMDIASSATDRHFTRSLLFLASPEEDTLLISVGSSCDVCNEKDTDHAAVLFYNVKTKEHGIYATGLRNATFMTLDPVSGKVFASEMGRDNLGDNLPPDEINIIEKGKNYGWPYCYGKNIRDTKFSQDLRLRCTEGTGESPSFIDLQAHSAPLGLSFIPEEGWPEDYWYDLLVAYHGSWNRSEPTGYKIIRLKMSAKGVYEGAEDFISGWLTTGGKKTGRPVDIKVFSGGVAYISDDSSGVIYRLARTK